MKNTQLTRWRKLGSVVRRKVHAIVAIVGLAGVALHLAQAAAPLAGTNIGNQASATYTDATNTTRTATSNVAITVVQQVSSFTLTTDGQAKFAAAGTQVAYPHTIVNTGNGADDFTLSAANTGGAFTHTSIGIYADANGDGVPDNNTAITTTGNLAAGATFRFVVTAIVPGSAAAADTGIITVTAAGTATGTPAAAQTNADTTTVTNNAVIAVTKSIDVNQGAAGSGPYTYTLTYTNTGNANAVNLTLTDTVPTGMTYVAGSARWSVTGATPLTDATADTQGSAPDTIDYSYNGGSKTLTAIIARVIPGETRTLTFQANVAGSQGAGIIANTGAYTYDPGTGTPIGPYSTNTVDFTVTQAGSVSITGDTVPSAAQGTTVVFTNTVTNTGNGSDSFDITVTNTSFPAGTSFAFFKSDGNTPLVGTNGNTTPDTGTLTAGATYDVKVKATLPAGSSGVNVNYTASITATSKLNPAGGGVASANDILTTVTTSTVDVTNTSALPGAPGAGAGPEGAAVVTNSTNPNTTTRFTLYVNNTSSVADSYDLAASTVAGFGSLTLPAGWTATFRDSSNAVVSNTGAMAAGANKLIYVDITIPSGQAPATTEIYFRALSPTTGATDRIHDAVTVNQIRNIAITPNNAGQVFASSTAVYGHIITNNGNAIEGDGVASAITLATSDSLAGWSSVVYYDANGNGVVDSGESVVTNMTFSSNGGAGLAAGESVRLIVKVTAPAGAPVGATDVATLTVTTSAGTYSVAAPAVVTSTDTSTVIAGYLTMLKEQALDANLDGNPDAGYSTANLTTGALPGKGIRYRITVTNTGTAAATNVVVYDATPAFTHYTTTGAAAVTGGSAPNVTTAPANNATGSLEFAVGTRNPGESAVVTFGVIIDP